LERVGQRAKQRNGERFANLLSHIKEPLLKEAYERLRHSAAPGVEGVTWCKYGENLDARLRDLQDRVHRGDYHPQPVRRVHIPKGDGRMRPLGIPTLEDKLVQQAARMLLEPICEQEFLGFSYGFRPGRSQHRALDALAVAIGKKVSWVLDADIRAFYRDHEVRGPCDVVVEERRPALAVAAMTRGSPMVKRPHGVHRTRPRIFRSAAMSC
jgi:retron-type reverse transcriptase